MFFTFGDKMKVKKQSGVQKGKGSYKKFAIIPAHLIKTRNKRGGELHAQKTITIIVHALSKETSCSERRREERGTSWDKGT